MGFYKSNVNLLRKEEDVCKVKIVHHEKFNNLIGEVVGENNGNVHVIIRNIKQIVKFGYTKPIHLLHGFSVIVKKNQVLYI